jgi:AAA domain
VDLDERAGRLQQVKWRTDHTAFTADCPYSNGTVHRIAVSTVKTKCLGGCADDRILEFFQNGTAPKPLLSTPTVTPDLTSWLLKLHELGKQILDQSENPRLLAGSTRDSLVDTLVTDYRNAIKANIGAVLPLPELSESELDEELYRVAGVVVDAFQKQWAANLPVVVESGDVLDNLPNLIKTRVEVLNWMEMRGRRATHVRDWVVEGMLARRETSSWSGKVEAGKTTLMRELTMAVIRGEPFLGRPTAKGRVFYAMLDADGEDVTYDEFAKLGFTDDDADWCKFMFEPNMAQIERGLEQFVKILKDFEPILVIIDPYPRLKIIEDFHSYTNTYLMGMLSEIAKMINAHLALPGHIPRGRGDDDDVATAGFGSISFSGGVNARFVVTNRNGIHTVRSSKGKAAGFVPFDGELTLQLDPDNSRVYLGEPFSWKDKGRAAVDPVAAFLAANNDRPFDLASLAREIHLQKSVVRTALGNLVNEGRIRRAGEGLKRSPFVYSSKTYLGDLTIAEVKRE